jgi:hypothetical protein
VPLVAVFLPVAWLLLTRVVPPDVERSAPRPLLDDARNAERADAARPSGSCSSCSCLTALAWVFRPLLEDLTIGGAPRSPG